MPELSPHHRAKLDGIVQQMAANGESDASIRAVVDDFKAKYSAPQGWLGRVMNAIEKTDLLGISESLDNSGDAVANLPQNWRAAQGADAKTKVASDLARTVMEPYGKAALAVGAVANPVGTAGAVGTGLVGAGLGNLTARAFDAGPGVTAAAEDVGGLLGSKAGYEGLTWLGQRVAQGLSSSALGVTPAGRQFGKEAGRAVLEETKGIRPKTIRGSAKERLSALSQAKDAELASAGPVSLDPARRALTAAKAVAEKKGNATLYEELSRMEPNLYGNQVTGQPYGNRVPADQALDILQGFADEHTRFIEGRTTRGNDAAKDVWGTLRDSIRKAAPASEALDRRMSNLADVPKMATKASNRAGIVETGVDKATRSTGGLAAAIAATMAGGPKAGAAALMAQESLNQSATKMALARALWRASRGNRVGVPTPIHQMSAPVAPVAAPAGPPAAGTVPNSYLQLIQALNVGRGSTYK